jgi:hypothetical protein
MRVWFGDTRCVTARPLRRLMRGAHVNRHSTLEERFWAKVDCRAPDECWNFTARIERTGYGIAYVGTVAGRRIRIGAHRLSWILAHGEITDDLCVLHRCDNRRCVNPGHLFLGTKKDNYHDMVAKGRLPSQNPGWIPVRGEKINTAKLSAADVLEIRKRHGAGESASALARAFGISSRNASSIVNRQSWSWL